MQLKFNLNQVLVVESQKDAIATAWRWP